MNSTKGEALRTAEFLGMSLSNFLIYITQYAMIAALPIVIMTEYGGGDVEAGLAMTFFQIGTVVARPCYSVLPSVGRLFSCSFSRMSFSRASRAFFFSFIRFS